ncbi:MULTISPECIES: radical SAM/SPASM domain-containing protein [Streptomyces]|uniref:Radical SAM protein n=1 Tax=Streptomyces tsukubensis (strain DSM 42081 / NBRC 108919 / NRRL 18488 / 9993) TaxID=1114943 RepID=I2N2F9_STRT9|nr:MULTISPECIES: radical SAM/SPASM domain-containing protein [Streptomyces]AZK95328.1 radical SAM protein [Streptomyces tsukubensis]EIF91206.1 radical SAM protein [Streptomyces tsukubensis NRRL18488]MYS62974.1 radical SAM protein [Streptomyces sp. SID5473]QKM68622.1 radical SAM protein [Streptomyces tsukubensis NRRL18488]TAI43428.1 radical SAM protein [Streptomyces tsukubensis]
MTVLSERPLAVHGIRTLELEITGKCQLSCSHCLSESGPQATHGEMTPTDWRNVITDAAALGIPRVQLIGGEPTVHPQWRDFTGHALGLGLDVEVYSNLFHVARSWWETFQRTGVTLATSYYSDDPDEHDRITGKRGSYLRTRVNIEEALRRRVPVRVGIVAVLPGQRVDEARTELEAMGVRRINTDRARAIGRAMLPGQSPALDEMCGGCTRGRAAVLPNGDLVGCVLSRDFPAGNVREHRLHELLVGRAWAELSASIPLRRSGGNPCNPDCNPSKDGSDCAPAEQEACDPAFE